MPIDPFTDLTTTSTAAPIQPPSAAELPALEVIILWGETVLQVSHLAPARAFFVGEGAVPSVDYVIGRESLGVERLPIVLEEQGHCSVVFGAGADGDVTFAGQVISLGELMQQGQLSAVAGLPGARSYPLPQGAAAAIRMGRFTFLVQTVALARWVDVRERAPLRNQGWTLSSTLLHVLVLVAFYFMPPQSSALSIDRLAEDPRFVAFASEPPARDADLPDWMAPHAPAAEGGGDRAAEGPSGTIGEPEPKAPAPARTNRRPSAQTAPTPTREASKASARTGGIIDAIKTLGTLQSSAAGVFRRDAASDAEDEGLAALLGQTAQAGSGFGGLGPIGTGRGGGGHAVGTIGSGDLDTRGHEGGVGTGTGPGYGAAAGGLHTRDSHVPHIRGSVSEVRGSLSKEIIRRTISRHLSEVRACYEQALIARPDLEGRVSIKFVIGASGVVQTAVLESNEIADVRVGHCITASVQRWTFPAPEGGGLVIVTYPFLLTQTGN